MKNLFFYSNMRTFDMTAGITRKVMEEIEAFRKLNYNVLYSGYLKNGVAIFDNNNKIIKKTKFLFKNEKLNHALRRYLLIILCCNFMKTTRIKFDVAYLRYHFFDYFYIRLLKLIKRKNVQIILESHFYPTFDKNDDLNIFKILDRIYSKKASNYCSLVAAMNNYKKLWNIPTFEIDNTLLPESYTLRNYSSLKDEFVFINIAFESIYHGMDRFLKSVYEYEKKLGYKENKMKLKIILIGEYLESTKTLVKDLGLSKIVVFTGKKTKQEIDKYINQANMGIGMLANHRVDSYYGSALKTKEYMARGLPFIYGWNERILENFPYAFKVSLDETLIDLHQVIEFYKQIESNDLSNKIREYLTINSQSWEIQFKNMFIELERYQNESSI